jgi:hypothetical protein
MTWKTIDSTDALHALDYRVCWEDGGILEAYRIYSNQSYFPKDVNRSGYNNPNLHLLIDTGLGESELLELVLIETDLKSISSLSGHVSPLNIVHLTHGHASRIIYRRVDNEKQYKAGYFVENWET